MTGAADFAGPRRPVGRTGLALTPMSFGAAAIGNLYRATGEDEARAAVDAAWDVGVRYFDTAPHYGLGLSERRLGSALGDRPREEYVLSTKVGRLLEPNPGERAARDSEGFDVPATLRRRWDFSGDGIRRSIEDSLNRLGLDRIDIVYVHDPDDHWAQASTGAVPALVELREQGVIGAVGVGMNQSAILTEFVRRTDVDLVMLAGRYTLLEQGGMDELLPLCVERGVSVVNVAVFNSGLLARDRPAPSAMYNYEPAPPELIERVGLIADVCESHGVTLPSAAVQFGLSHPAVVTVTIGCRNEDQVRRNAAMFAHPIPPAMWRELAERGLIRADAPVPLE